MAYLLATPSTRQRRNGTHGPKYHVVGDVGDSFDVRSHGSFARALEAVGPIPMPSPFWTGLLIEEQYNCCCSTAAIVKSRGYNTDH